MVVVFVLQGHCEIEFFPDGSIEVQWFRGDEAVNRVDTSRLGTFIEEQCD